MGLSASELNDTDKMILEVLEEGRATPNLVRAELATRGKEVSRQYVSRRLKRLREHDHVRTVLETSTYELVDDPRN